MLEDIQCDFILGSTSKHQTFTLQNFSRNLGSIRKMSTHF